MSLINDALKRAQKAQQNHPSPGAAPLPPVEYAARGGTGWLLATAAVFLLAAACFLIGVALVGQKAQPVAAAAAPAIPLRLSAEVAPVPATNAAPTPAQAAPVMATNAPPPPVEVAPAIATNAPPPAVAAGKRPSVQGIIFNSNQPLAIVNGKTVKAGEHVGNFQVKQILPHNVIFQLPDGSEKTVGIGE